MSEKEKDTKTSSSEKSAKVGLGQRISKFFKEYRGELKKISWPTFAEVVKNTMITLAAVLMIGVVIWIFDYAITTLRDLVISIDRPSASDVVEELPSQSELDAVVSAADVSASDVSAADAASTADAQ